MVIEEFIDLSLIVASLYFIFFQSDASLKRIDIVSDSDNYYFTLGDIVSAICLDSYKTDMAEYIEVWYVPDPVYILSFHGFIFNGNGVTSTICREARIYYFPW